VIVDEIQHDYTRYEISQWIYHWNRIEEVFKDQPCTGERWACVKEYMHNFFELSIYHIWHANYSQASSKFKPYTCPLHLAASQGWAICLKFLLDEMAYDANDMSTGESPLYAGLEYPEIVEILLDHGADIELSTAEATTSPFLKALSGLYENQSKDPTGQNAELIARNRQVVDLMVRRGADINATGVARLEGEGAYDAFILEIVAWMADSDLLDTLLKHPTQKLNLNQTDCVGSTALHQLFWEDEAFSATMATFASKLIQYGADVNAQNAQSQGPLAWASKCGDIKSMQLLLEHGAEVDDDDVFGFTALHRACQPESQDDLALERIKILVEHGADFERVASSDGTTPLSLAVERQYVQAYEYLLEQHEAKHGADYFYLLAKDSHERSML